MQQNPKVMYALLQTRPYFTHYLARAPSIWWAERQILKHAANLRARESRLPAKLFLAVGEKDSESMRGDLAVLEEQLAAHPFTGLELSSRRFPDRDHYNVLGDAFRAGLEALFGRPENARP